MLHSWILVLKDIADVFCYTYIGINAHRVPSSRDENHPITFERTRTDSGTSNTPLDQMPFCDLTKG